MPDQHAKALHNLARLQMVQGRHEDAVSYLRKAVELVERLRLEGESPQRRRQILEQNLQIYESLIICLMRLEQYEEALAFAERGRSRTLLDLLAERSLQPRNAPPHLRQRYEQLMSQLNELRNAIEKPDPQEPPETRSASLQKRKVEYQPIEQELQAVTQQIRE